MSNNAHIDKIFKEGLGEKDFSNVDAMWQKMELSLDNNTQKRKRRLVFFILFACLLTAGFFAVNHFTKTTSAIVVSQNNTDQFNIDKAKENLSQQGTISTAISESNAVSSSVPETKTTKYSVTSNTSNTKIIHAKQGAFNERINEGGAATTIAKTVVTSRRRPSVIIASADKESTEFNGVATEDLSIVMQTETDQEFRVQKNTVVADLILMQRAKVSSAISIQPVLAKGIINTKVQERKRESLKEKKISIDLIAGGDILRMNRSAGYYAGVRVSHLLEKGILVSAGVSYSSNTVNDKYRLLSKPAEQREADVQLSKIEMIRVPVYFQRQMANTQLSLMVGLIPSYIIKASVYNVPNAFTGSNPDQYRKFAENDLNRFNILFGAGLKYAPFNRMAFELSGSYGFTSMVKNSYMNQSRVNDNFKSIQVGVVYKLK